MVHMYRCGLYESDGYESLKEELDSLKYLAQLRIIIASVSVFQRFLNFDSLREIKFDWAGKGEETVEYRNLNPEVKCFHGLLSVYICKCQMLKNMTWHIFAPNLKYLAIGECDEIVESVHWNPLPFLYLERIEVDGCPKLKKLPLDSNSAKERRVVITGKQLWWNELE
ncbi:putative disease resistance protein [Vitis vinifera]|uniref:Putative disease resistance protein n=1 Tax=Vitis vinifera TaxID=29760 RepID=A0A438D650_VITVI|nr:putative disease resistance protein [Vitis vinifera]